MYCRFSLKLLDVLNTFDGTYCAAVPTVYFVRFTIRFSLRVCIVLLWKAC